MVRSIGLKYRRRNFYLLITAECIMWGRKQRSWKQGDFGLIQNEWTAWMTSMHNNLEPQSCLRFATETCIQMVRRRKFQPPVQPTKGEILYRLPNTCKLHVDYIQNFSFHLPVNIVRPCCKGKPTKAVYGYSAAYYTRTLCGEKVCALNVTARAVYSYHCALSGPEFACSSWTMTAGQ